MLSYCITKYHLNIHTAIHKLTLEAIIRNHRTEQRQGLYSNEIQTAITSQVMEDFAWNKCTWLRAASLTPELQPDARTRNRCNSFVQNQLISHDTATHEETLKLASFFLYKLQATQKWTLTINIKYTKRLQSWISHDNTNCIDTKRPNMTWRRLQGSLNEVDAVKCGSVRHQAALVRVDSLRAKQVAVNLVVERLFAAPVNRTVGTTCPKSYMYLVEKGELYVQHVHVNNKPENYSNCKCIKYSDDTSIHLTQWTSQRFPLHWWALACAHLSHVCNVIKTMFDAWMTLAYKTWTHIPCTSNIHYSL